jgi:hypothetical protein
MTAEIMGSAISAKAALIAKATEWRKLRQPIMGNPKQLRDQEIAEREARFQLANTALIWLWHEEATLAEKEGTADEVERVARAVYANNYPDSPLSIPLEDIPSQYVADARVAIAAMNAAPQPTYGDGLRRAAEIVGYLLESGETKKADIAEAQHTILSELSAAPQSGVEETRSKAWAARQAREFESQNVDAPAPSYGDERLLLRTDKVSTTAIHAADGEFIARGRTTKWARQLCDAWNARNAAPQPSVNAEMREALREALREIETAWSHLHPHWEGSAFDNAVIRRARAALARAAAVKDGWLPIETAPKDGTEILTVGNDSGAVIATKWLSPGPYVRTPRQNYYRDAGWYWASWSEAVGPVSPTHWRPLPPPPSQEEPG